MDVLESYIDTSKLFILIFKTKLTLYLSVDLYE